MSRAPTVTLGGHELNERFSISDLRRDLPASRLTTEQVPGRRGELVRGSTMGPRRVSLRLWSHHQLVASHERIVEDMALLHSWLWPEGGGPLELALSDEGGRVREVWPEGELDVAEYERRGSVGLTLLQPDPLCWLGAWKSVAIDNGARAIGFEVEHANPALRVTVSEAYATSEAPYWALAFETGEFMKVRIAPETWSNTAEIDCEARTVTVNGSASALTLDSDWPELAAGQHTASQRLGSSTSPSSYGSCRIWWRERCV